MDTWTIDDHGDYRSTDIVSVRPMYPVIHKSCGQTAILMLRRVQAGEEVLAADFEHLDGTSPRDGDEISSSCDSCGGKYTGIGLGLDGTVICD